MERYITENQKNFLIQSIDKAKDDTEHWLRDYCNFTSFTKQKIYKDIYLSWKTIYKREILRKSLDKYCFFEWDNVKSFPTFGCFILNEKREELTARVGQDFSNKFNQIQYDESSGQLQGISFKNQQIKFTVGLYWISNEDFQSFLDWMSPYRIGNLYFGYNNDFHYQVKLSSLKEGKKIYLGKDYIGLKDNIFYINEDDGNNKYIFTDDYDEEREVFYIELSLVFDIVGDNCCISRFPYPFKWNNNDKVFTWNNEDKNRPKDKQSDLNTYFNVNFQLEKNRDIRIMTDVEIVLKIEIPGMEEIELFSFSIQSDFLNNLYSILTTSILSFHYDSKKGEIYWGYSDVNKFLLSALSDCDGNRLIGDIFNINKFFLPGKFLMDLKYDNIRISLTTNNQNISITPSLVCYSRKKSI